MDHHAALAKGDIARARTIDSCDQQTSTGLRDRAVLLLLARLGLRANEIITLRLDDCDWDTGCLRVRGKGGRERVQPMPTDVGEAIAAYLQHGRPVSQNRHLFLRSLAPIRGFRPSSDAIGSITRHALRRARSTHPIRGRISSATRWRFVCLNEVPRSQKSVKCWVIAVRRRHRSMPAWISVRFVRSPCRGRGGAMNTLREALQEYLALRRGPGYRRHDAGRLLPRFVRFMKERGAAYITARLVLAWVQQATTVQPAERARRLSFARGFARYRSAVDTRQQAMGWKALFDTWASTPTLHCGCSNR